MRIVNVMFGRELGGLEQVCVDYHTALSGAGHEVITWLRDGAQVEIPKKAGNLSQIETIRFSPISFFTKRSLGKKLADIDPDMVILHGNRPLSLLGRAKEHKAVSVFVAHNFRFKTNLRYIDKVIAVSIPVGKALEAFGIPVKNIAIVENMTSQLQVQMRQEVQPIPVIGFIGRLHWRKGADLVLKALHQIKQEGHMFKALLAGDGPLKSELRELIDTLDLSEDVEMLGWVKDTNQFYQSIDITLMPSRSEPFGLCAIESLAAGVPLIASSSEGVSTIVTHGRNGLLVPCDRYGELAVATKELLTDPQLYRDLKLAGLERAQDFSTKSVTRRLTAAIRGFKTE